MSSNSVNFHEWLSLLRRRAEFHHGIYLAGAFWRKPFGSFVLPQIIMERDARDSLNHLGHTSSPNKPIEAIELQTLSTIQSSSGEEIRHKSDYLQECWDVDPVTKRSLPTSRHSSLRHEGS